VSRIMDLNVILVNTADLPSVGIKIKGKGFMKPKINPIKIFIQKIINYIIKIRSESFCAGLEV
jgi:hypothetical protein